MANIIVPPKGPHDSPFVIVGEAPGAQEIKDKAPFVGPSGTILNAGLEQFTIGSYPEPYVTNVVPHMIQGEKSQDLLAEFAMKHRERLLAEINAHPRKVILALGSVAIMALTGDTSLKITKVRGQRFQSTLAEMGIVASTHPAYLLRGGGSFRQFKADVAYALRLATGGKPHEFVPPTWEYVDTLAKAKEFVDRCLSLTSNDYIAGDLETKGFSHRMDQLLMGGYTFDGKHVYVVPGHKREYIANGWEDMFHVVKDMWKSPARFVWHNGKFDVKFLWHQYGQQARVDEDTMLMSYALDETRGIHDLETVASDWLGSPNWKGVLDSHKKKNDSYDVIPEPVLTKYMAYDIANTYNLVDTLRPLVANDAKSELLYTRTLIPGSKYLARIEMHGMQVDTSRVAANKVEYQGLADKYKEEINQIAITSGYGPINPNSPVQLKDFLFNTLKIPSREKSTNVKVLDSLPDHPAVLALKKYRKINKGLTTYVTPVTDHIQDDGRVHQSYLIHGAATGRLACKDPNLQNIPREPKLRGQFIPREGYCIIEIDLNQAELRSLAALSGDKELCRIYTDPSSKGLHEEVRAEIFGHPEEWSTSQLQQFMDRWYTNEVSRVLEEQKMRAKNTNFGIVYGITSKGLAEQIEGTPAEASRMLAAWAKKFPEAWAFIEACRRAPLMGKNLVTVFGHKKRFGIVSRETLVEMQNQAANFPHQSTASTITLHGGMRLQDRLEQDYNTFIVNTVHDSLLLEAPAVKEAVEAICKVGIAELEQVPIDWGITRIPFKAESKVGLRWGELTSNQKFYHEQGWDIAA